MAVQCKIHETEQNRTKKNNNLIILDKPLSCSNDYYRNIKVTQAFGAQTYCLLISSKDDSTMPLLDRPCMHSKKKKSN